jgi:HAD superfamily hydrolase (TIGR01509 family)
VLWDVEGTLVRRVHSPLEVAARELSRRGIDPASVDPSALTAAQRLAEQADLWRSDEEERAGFEAVARLVLDGSGRAAPASLATDLGAAFASAYDAFEVTPGIPSLVSTVTALGARQGVVSNWPASLERFLDHVGLVAHFEVVVSSGREGVLKPDPALLRWALERLGVGPAQAVVVGNDPVNDIAPARALGCEALLFDPSGHAPGAITTAEALERSLTPMLAGARGPAGGR